MADVTFTIGQRDYTLQSQPGEEKILERAAALLNAEAQAILAQAGRMPEPRLLLLSGLMLADRMNATEDRAATAEREASRLRKEAEAQPVAIVPRAVQEGMAELAARAESLAERFEDTIEQE